MSRRSQGQPHALRALEKAARAFQAAEEKLARAILVAHDAGASLRAIARVTGVSHEKVRTMIERERRRVREQSE